MFSSNEKLGLAALGLVAGLIAARALIVKGIELAVLGIGKGTSGLFEKMLPGANKAVPAGPKQGADGKWRDAAGKFTKAPTQAPAQLPTTAKGVGMGMLSDMGKQLTQAMGWVLKAGAIAGAMYMIGKALPTLAEGVKSFDGVNWEDMGKAGVSIAGVSAALFALGRIPISAILQGLAGAAAVSGIMVLLGFGFSKLTPELMAFQALDWETMAKAGVALVGLMAIGAVAGTFFAPLLIGAGVLGALGLALRAFPIDVLEALGKLFEAVGATIGGVVTKMAEGVGLIVDKFTALRNSGIEATTIQIERLSKIPSDQLFSAAAGVKALKDALSDFGPGFWSNIGNAISSFFGEDQASQVERMAAAMERYKKSVSVLKETSSGDFVLKPIDIGLYTQLQQTLDETKKKIDTTFSKKTYEETFVATTKAIDGTYNVKTSKLDITLEQTREAIKKTFTPPYDELTKLTKAIKDAVSNASSGLTSPDPDNKTGPLGVNKFGESADTYANNVANFKGKGASGKIYKTALGRDTVYGKNFNDMTTDQQDQFLDAMTRQEGGKPENLNMRMNNPGNILWAPSDQARILKKYSRFGMVPGDKANGMIYGKFPTFAQGREAQRYRVSEIKGTGAQALATWLGATGGKKPTLVERAQNIFTPDSPEARMPLPIDGSSGGGALPMTGNDKFKQLRNVDGKLLDAENKVAKPGDGTITAVSNEGDIQGKMLNLLEQTYNLHVGYYGETKTRERFKGFTAG